MSGPSETYEEYLSARVQALEAEVARLEAEIDKAEKRASWMSQEAGSLGVEVERLTAKVKRLRTGERERQIALLEGIDQSAVEADKDSVGYDCGASTRRILRAKLAELRKGGGTC